MYVFVSKPVREIFNVRWTLSISNTLYLEQLFRSLSIDSSLIFSLYLELSLSRTNSLVP